MRSHLFFDAFPYRFALLLAAFALVGLPGSANPNSKTVVTRGSGVTVGNPVGVQLLSTRNGVTLVLRDDLAPGDDFKVEMWGGQETHGPIPTDALTDVINVTLGLDHFEVLKRDGSIVVWGASLPSGWAPPEVLTNAVAMVAGDHHLVVLKNDRSVMACGTDASGPVVVPPTIGTNAVALAADGGHSLALLADGSVVAWGDPSDGLNDVPPGALSDVVGIAAGVHHNVALRRDGNIVTWGSKAFGLADIPDTLGRDATHVRAGGNSTAVHHRDGRVTFIGELSAIGPDFPASVRSAIFDIAVGDGYAFALVDPPVPVVSIHDGSRTLVEGQRLVLVADLDDVGGLLQWRKDGTLISGATLGVLDLGFAVSASAGEYTVEVKNSSGSATSIPPSIIRVEPARASVVSTSSINSLSVSALDGVSAIAAGYRHALAVRANGEAFGWGWNDFGQSDVPVEGRSGAVEVSAGANHSLILKADGTVIGWGNDVHGQATVPVEARSGVVAIAAGFYHSLALKSDGRVVAWGENGHHQCEVTESAMHGVIAIAAGTAHSTAVRMDGSVVTWGDDLSDPAQIPAAARSGVVAVAAGDGFTLALRSDGTCIGWNATTHFQPAIVPAGRRVVAISAGQSARAVLLDDGSVPSISDASSGQLFLHGVARIAASDFGLLAIRSAVPWIDAARSGESLILSGAGEVTGFVLQTAASLAAPVRWIDAAVQPAKIGDRWTATLLSTESARYYRLYHP